MRETKLTKSETDAEQIPSRATAPSSPTYVEIETSDQKECGSIIADILKKVEEAEQQQVFLEYSGSESLGELLPLWFTVPTEEDRAEIEKIQRKAKLSVGLYAAKKDVMIPTEPSILSSEHTSVPGINEDVPISDEMRDDLYQKLISELPNVKGFETEEWGKQVILQADSGFPTAAFFVGKSDASEMEKNADFEEFLRTTLNEVGNGNQNTHLQSVDCEVVLKNDAALEGVMSQDEFDVGNYDLDGLDLCDGSLPDEVITSNFVFEMVLKSVSSSPASSSFGAPIYQVDRPGTSTATTAEFQNSQTPGLQEGPEDAVRAETNADFVHEHYGQLMNEDRKEDTETVTDGVNDNYIPVQNASDDAKDTISRKPLIKDCKVVLNRVQVDKASAKENTVSTNDCEDNQIASTHHHQPEECTSSSETRDLDNESWKAEFAAKISNKFKEWKKAKMEKAQTSSNTPSHSNSPNATVKTDFNAISLRGDKEKQDATKKADSPAPIEYTASPKPKSLKALSLDNQPSASDKQTGEIENPPDINQPLESKLATHHNEDHYILISESATARRNSPKRQSPKNNLRKKRKLLNEDQCPPVRPSTRGCGQPSKYSNSSSETPAKVQKVASTEPRTAKEWTDWMSNEMSNPNPDLSKLSDALTTTFNARKKRVESSLEVSKIVSYYPALSIYQMVKEEYGRKLEVVDINKMRRLEESLKEKLLQALSPVSPQKKKFSQRHSMQEKAVKYWSANKNKLDNNERERQEKVLGMVALCFFLAENSVQTTLCKMLEDNEELTTEDKHNLVTPTVVLHKSQLYEGDTELWIWVEGKRYLKVPNFYEAVLCIYAIYYVFDLQYEEKLKALFEYFDELNGIN